MKDRKEIQRDAGRQSSKDSVIANEAIKHERLQLITADGENIGIVSRLDALKSAKDAGLDLILLSESGGLGVPVAKIMNYGKELYLKKKKSNESKKNQKIIQVKEIKMRPKIGDHDYQFKLNQAIGFLKDDKKLKITLTFGKGRELATRNERGQEMFAKILKSFEDAGLADKLIEEKDSSAMVAWSKLYSLKKPKG